MSYRKLLTHRCDVYRLGESSGSAGGFFGIPLDDVVNAPEYGSIPISTDVPCYFTEKIQSVVQREPNQTIFQSFLVHFLPNADIKINDKVVWEGTAYMLQQPRKIKNHHIEVTVIRGDNL